MGKVTVFDVANYILKKLNGTSTMKLQKLVFYCQAYSLAWDEAPLFDEDFEAWANGPVCRELYKTHKGKFELPANMYSNRAKGSLTNSQKELIDVVLDEYGDQPAQRLIDLTHLERPWKETREEANCKTGQRCNAVIDKDLIQEYYSSLPDMNAAEPWNVTVLKAIKESEKPENLTVLNFEDWKKSLL